MSNNDMLRTPEVRAVLDKKPQYFIKWGTLFAILFFIIGCLASTKITIPVTDTFSAKYLKKDEQSSETKNLYLTFIINSNGKPVYKGDKVTLNYILSDKEIGKIKRCIISEIDREDTNIRMATLKLFLKTDADLAFYPKVISRANKITIEIDRKGKSAFELFWQNI
jgi:hypothetical protein